MGVRGTRSNRGIGRAIAHRLQPIRDWRWVLQRIGLGRLMSPSRLPVGGKLRRAYPKTVRPPLVDPPMAPATDADHMHDDDVVLGIVVDGEARAYPWWILLLRHVANDVVGGRPAAVILCHQCSSGMAFDPVVDGRRLTFEVRDIFNGTAAMRDRETGTLWSPFLGLAIHGELKGNTISLLPLWQMEWARWRELHPETLVLTGDPALHPWRKASIDRSQIGRRFRETAARMDPRLPPSTLVLGVVTAGGQRAYPVQALTSGSGVVNDEVGGIPVVVLAHPARGSYGAVAFSRDVAGRTLTFQAGPNGPTDQETGSRWSLEGRAADGPLAGAQLPYVASHVAMWYVWAAHFPGIDLAP
jgi:hypothetical protein